MDHLGLGPLGTALDRTQFGLGATVEELGFGALWIAGGQLDTLERIAELVAVTRSARIVPGIVPVDVYRPPAVAELFHRLEGDAPGRFVVGLGGPQRGPALSGLHAYLDRLDELGVPASRRIVAALGPRKLALARDRAAGAVTLLTTAEFTASAREALGPDRTLVADLFVVLDDDADRARAAARRPLEFLSGVAGYRANFARMGFTDEDATSLSDRFVDRLVPWGDADTIADAVAAHHAAGADHVVLSPLATASSDDALVTLRTLASRALGT